MDSFIVITIGLHVISMFSQCTDGQVLSTCFLPLYNQECEINCTTPDQSKIVAFYKLPDEIKIFGQCFGTTCQIGNHISNTDYSIRSTDSTTTTLLINNLSWDDKGTWRCDYDVTPNTTVLGFAKYPDEIESSGLSNNSEVFSGTEMSITMKCLYTEISTLVTLIYVSNGQTARSTPVTCTDTTSACANNNFYSKLCKPIVQVETGVVCDGNYSIEIATSVLGNEERKYSLLNGITIKCKSDATDDGITSCLLSLFQGVWGWILSIVSIIVDKLAECVQFTFDVVQQWYFTCRYIFKGKVVYGLQLVIIAAVTQLISMIPLLLAFTTYADNLRFYACVSIPILFTVGPFIACGIYLLYKWCCGQKECLYTKFNTKRTCVMLSNEYGKKLNTVTKDKIYFKVEASNDLFISLLDDQQKRIVDIILGGCSQQSPHGANQNDRVVYFKDVLISTVCRTFVLECGPNYITVTELSRGIEKPVLEWKPTNDDQGLEICDIVISNFMQEIRTLGEQSGNPGEQSGNPEEQSGNLREQSGNPGKQSGNTGEQSGNPEEQSGNPGKQSGNPGEQSGNPEEQSGNPGEQSGNPREQSGNSGEQSGNPGEQSGNPREQSGNSGEQSGNPREQSGNPREQSGNPREQSGNPGEQSGNPREQSGNPREQSGNSGEQSGNPGECTFLLRQGDCLLDNEDDSSGLSCGIFLVILFPIPWILYLLLRKVLDTSGPEHIETEGTQLNV